MKFVYPLKGTSRNEWLELRYSLRTVARYAPGSEPVIITDRPPRWYAGDILRIGDDGSHKRAITTHKLDRYARRPDAPAQWMLMCDDFFLHRTERWWEVPLYHGPCLRIEAARFRQTAHKSDKISRIFDHTADLCEAVGVETLSFERHLPLRIVTEIWTQAHGIEHYNDPPGIQPQSIYGNHAAAVGVPIQEIADLKFWTRQYDDEDRRWKGHASIESVPADRTAWSVEDRVGRLKSFRVAMEALFPEPSPWEKRGK